MTANGNGISLDPPDRGQRTTRITTIVLVCGAVVLLWLAVALGIGLGSTTHGSPPSNANLSTEVHTFDFDGSWPAIGNP
jgi:ABC-type Fe3+ transport system permease subunit